MAASTYSLDRRSCELLCSRRSLGVHLGWLDRRSRCISSLRAWHESSCFNTAPSDQLPCHYIRASQPILHADAARATRVFMAIITFGEGYHNYHHEFQHDYRNGVKPWQWDPTKWLIWSFSKVGLASGLRRARAELVSSSEANVRKTVTSEQVTSKAGKNSNEHFLARNTAQQT